VSTPLPLTYLCRDIDGVVLRKNSIPNRLQKRSIQFALRKGQYPTGIHCTLNLGKKILPWGAVGGWGARKAAGTEQMSTPALKPRISGFRRYDYILK
jgi:hypothetical protein